MNLTLTKELIEAIDSVDPNLEVNELAGSIAFILNEYYNEKNKNQFLETLKTKLKWTSKQNY